MQRRIERIQGKDYNDRAEKPDMNQMMSLLVAFIFDLQSGSVLPALSLLGWYGLYSTRTKKEFCPGKNVYIPEHRLIHVQLIVLCSFVPCLQFRRIKQKVTWEKVLDV